MTKSQFQYNTEKLLCQCVGHDWANEMFIILLNYSYSVSQHDLTLALCIYMLKPAYFVDVATNLPTTIVEKSYFLFCYSRINCLHRTASITLRQSATQS